MATNEGDEQLAYRPEGAARALDCSRDTVFRLLASGELRSFRVGSARFIAASELREFIGRREAAEGSA